MDTFSLDMGRRWVERLLGRNHLVRASDRLETIAIALAVIVAILAVPMAAAFGTSVKEARSSTYAQQAVSRHQTTAVAVADARLHVEANNQTIDVKARWSAPGGVHMGTVAVPEIVHAGDRFGMWVDGDGNNVGAPTPPSQAATEAVGWAVLAWLTLAAAMAAGVHALRRRLNRIRYAEWDRELDALAGNDGGRTNYEP